MNRRAFLVGLFGTATVASLGPLPNILEAEIYGRSPAMEALKDLRSINEWQQAIIKVFTEYQTDIFLYGTGAIKSIEEWPYVTVVDPRMIILKPSPTVFKGLLP